MLGKIVWTFSVHTAIDIKKRSVINVVCYERVCLESGLFWTSLLWTGLFWMVCYERSVMNGFVLNGHHFESLLCFNESRVSNCLLSLGSVQKPPHTEGGGGNCICCNNCDLKNKNVGNDSEVFRMSGNLNNNAPPDRDGRKDEARFNFRYSRASLYWFVRNWE